MTVGPSDAAAREQALLDRARAGDQGAYQELVESHRPELHAYCYRMLGSLHDADDALQDAMVRAWRGLPRFEGRSSVRSWLYRIATNTALDVSRRRAKRELPVSSVPASGEGEAPGPPLTERAWLEPFPDQAGAGAGALGPADAVYEQRESLELAFVVALQSLPPLQRAVLVLRDVLAFSAQEVAGQLGTSVPSVTSALQRARATAQRLAPSRSQQATLRALGDKRLQQLVGEYVDAIERGDASAVVALLTEDAAWAMPPVATWYRGRDAIQSFLLDYGFREKWRNRPTSANGQVALGSYTLGPEGGRYVASVLHVLTLQGDRICEVTGFVTAELVRRWGGNSGFVGSEAFPRFGLPAELA